MSKSKGTSQERNLLHKFNTLQRWNAIRLPGSGTGPQALPDLFVCSSKAEDDFPDFPPLFRDTLSKVSYYALELKTTNRSSRTISKEQVLSLIEFSQRFFAKSFLVIKFTQHARGKWFFIAVKDCPRTKEGNYSLRLKYLKEHGLELKEFVEKEEKEC